jgi:hypothetical protein
VARKDLSRTVIEGGRSYDNCHRRRASHGQARAQQRAWLSTLRHDVEEADDSDVEPTPHVGRDFHDKLAVIRRWLASRCGRPWTKVYSELRATFDTRTTAGRHIVFDHMLPDVWRGDPTVDVVRRERFFVVDAHGILRRGRYYGFRYSKARALFTGSRR